VVVVRRGDAAEAETVERRAMGRGAGRSVACIFVLTRVVGVGLALLFFL
jgi:hypothetical protein